ncbi:hypothetical protein Avbf_05599 [Armadillidium vulgare]|nr:hypothetical protein Avbf_05599 [Armadillidium vulgare]
MSVISPPSISFLHSKGDAISKDTEDSTTDFKAVYAAPSRGVLPPPAPPPRDPRTTLSVGRARAKSMVAGLHDFEALDNMHVTKEPVSMSRSAYYVSGFASTSDDSSTELSSPNANGGVGFSTSLSNGMKIATVHPRVVSTRSMSSSQGAESNPFEAPLRFSPTGKPPKVYASVAEMKKAKIFRKKDIMLIYHSRVCGTLDIFFFVMHLYKLSTSIDHPHTIALKARLAADSSRLHKDFHSTPDLQGEVLPVVLSQLSLEEKRKSLSQEELFISAQNAANQRLSLDSSHPLSSFEKKKMMQRVYDHPKLRRSQSAVNPIQLKVTVGSHPPPSHPPPPVPLGQVIKVDLNKPKGDYASVGNANEVNGKTQVTLQTSVEGNFNPEDPQSPGVKSSFRPSDSAKLYASPEDIKAFGYKGTESGTLTRNKNGIAKTRSQSLPPNAKRQQEPYIQEKETSGDSGVYSATYSTFRGRLSEGQSVDEAINEKITYARPKNNKSISDSSKIEPNKMHTRSCSVSSKPNIPEPDYSSDEESAYSLQEDLKKRPMKKKKQTVMFAPNLVSSSSRDMSDSPHYAAPSKNNSNSASTLGNGNFADLIAQKAAERKARQENGGGSAPAFNHF